MNNKEKCEYLRKVRLDIERKLNLDGIVRKEPCTYKGPCIGTCEACRQEEMALNRAISLKLDEINREKLKQNIERPTFIPPLSGMVVQKPKDFQREENDEKINSLLGDWDDSAFKRHVERMRAKEKEEKEEFIRRQLPGKIVNSRNTVTTKKVDSKDEDNRDK
jgi:hypothetical protein